MESIYDPEIFVKNPLVSISCITYNHEKYISECLNGILNQKTNFEFEIIIGDDCSSDKTFEMALDYQVRYSDKIKVIRSTNNIGPRKNSERNRNACRGKFIAFCEGDDYWTDPLKLQKQVDFLEQNPDYVLCYTDIQHYHENNNTFTNLVQEGIDTIELEDLFKKNYVTTLTAVFRNGLLTFPPEFQSLAIGDLPLFAMLGQFGKIKRLPIITGVYRIHGTNYFQGQSYIQKKLKVTQATEFLYRHFQPQYRHIAKDRLIDHYYLLADLYAKNRQFDEAYRFYKKMLGLMRNGWNVKVIRLKMLLWIYQIRNKISS